jgi:hypothetical protein
VIETPDGREWLSARCRVCSTERSFPAYLEPEDVSITPGDMSLEAWWTIIRRKNRRMQYG